MSAVLIRYIILKLILNLIEMGSSFLQLVVADSLGRLFLIPFPFHGFFRPEKPSSSFVASARVQQLSSLLQFFLQLLLLM